VLLSSCGGLTGGTPQALPTVVLDSSGGVKSGNQTASAPATARRVGAVTASGYIVPAQRASLAFAMAGQVESVAAAVGESVEAGQVLARLAGSEELQAALSAAELEVLEAEQALQKLSDDLPEEQAAALQALNTARDALRDAEQRVSGLGVPSEPIDIEVASSKVALAEKALEDAKEDFKPYENKPENSLKRAALLSKLAEAQERYDEAVERLNRMIGVITPEFDRQQAQTELEIAQAKLVLAQEKHDLLQNGPDPEAARLAEARLKSAQDRARAARASLANLELKAPFAGVLSAVNVQNGEWVTPGRTVFELVDLAHLRVETSDLSERDIPGVAVGQAALVFIEALNLEQAGTVSLIAPLADTLGGDVVYKTTIELESQPPGLRAGMSVVVRFEVGE
jgi:HlyD family secretion protein